MEEGTIYVTCSGSTCGGPGGGSVTVSVNGGSTATVSYGSSGGVKVRPGDTVTVSAVDEPGYAFDHWIAPGTTIDDSFKASDSFVYVPNGGSSVEAYFACGLGAVTVGTVDCGTGVVTFGGDVIQIASTEPATSMFCGPPGSTVSVSGAVFLVWFVGRRIVGCDVLTAFAPVV